eukprot:4462137-Pleurochrysis_carterae.AAC.3
MLRPREEDDGRGHSEVEHAGVAALIWRETTRVWSTRDGQALNSKRQITQSKRAISTCCLTFFTCFSVCAHA